jgi:hypothetical protein
MDGGKSPRNPASRVRHGLSIVALAAWSVLGIAASRSLSDDTTALRPLARRYADPTQVFDTEENEIAVRNVIAPEKTFKVPPRTAPPIRFAIEEPPVFVPSLRPVYPPLSMPISPAHFAPAPVATRQPDQRPPAASAVSPLSSQPGQLNAAARLPQNYQRPQSEVPQPPANIKIVKLPPQNEQQQPAEPSQPVADANVAVRPQSNYQRPASEIPQPPAYIRVVKLSPQTEPESPAASPPPSAPARVPTASSPQTYQRPRPAETEESAGPIVRFADAEPPAFSIYRPAPLQTVAAPVPGEMPAYKAAPIPDVVSPAEAPSFTVPAPPTLVPEVPAFASTEAPLNITIGALADQPPPPAPGVDASAAAAQSGAPGSFGEVEKLGDAPPVNTLDFLRQEAVLLKPGEHQFDWGIAYSVYNYTAALPVVNNSGTVTGVANERIRLQLMTIPFAFRYGLCDGLQAYVNAPLGWSNDETTNSAGGSLTNNFVSMGDISAGINYQIMKGCGAYCPDVIASIGFIAPTGHATFATSLLAPNSALGQGFWDITCSILAVHTIDPVIFYYGGGYVHRFDASFGDNLEVDPGQEFDYVFGCGFAVNPYVTISGTFIGNYITRYGVNDVSIPGSDLDLIRFRVSVTMVKDKRICEPWGEIGMTPDSPSRVGITFTY